MGCLKAGVLANVVVPTADYVRFATHYGFRPDFCHGGDPESKGMVENLVGYAKTDLMVPQLPFYDLWTANDAAEAWCTEVNAVMHSEISAVPLERLEKEWEVLRPLPQLRPEIGIKVISRKVDKLSCIRFGSARYSVPCRLIGTQVTITTTASVLSVIAPLTGEVLAEHTLVGPGASTMIITTVLARTSRTGHPAREPWWRNSSARWVRRRRRSWSAPPQPGCPSSVASSPTSTRSPPRTAATRWWRRWSGP
jgi:hypothetical protein